jgi:hypothetical protein
MNLEVTIREKGNWTPLEWTVRLISQISWSLKLMEGIYNPQNIKNVIDVFFRVLCLNLD